MSEVPLTNCIAPNFYEVHKLIRQNKYVHWWLKGGRGGTKSSFIAIEIILDIIAEPLSNAICFRKVGSNLIFSVYSQIYWAIEKLGVSNYFSKPLKEPRPIVYIPTGQKIIFWGMDDPRKIKSINLIKGYLKNSWYEELEEFDGMEEIRKVNQSTMRGGVNFRVFYSYNPPKSVNSWVNTEFRTPKKSRFVHHSVYLDVPVDWLGERFFIEAEELKKSKPRIYEHEYLGKITGTGGEVFNNVRSKVMTDEEIAVFDNIRQGIDWGFAISPFAFVKFHYDITLKEIYIFDEVKRLRFSDEEAMKLLKKRVNRNSVITADSNMPSSIERFKKNGFWIEGAKKGAESRRAGFMFLQRELNRIYIDPNRCPNALKEFTNYEYMKNRDGSWKDDYPKVNDHILDACRYSLEDYINNEVSSFDIV